MRFHAALIRSGAAFGLCAVLSGCFPSSQTALDEEKDPHFLAGKSRVNSRDFQGAIECFEKALEVNPHSAAAHFEVGLLYDNDKLDPAAAIYHLQKYLELRPHSEYADVVKGRIFGCKQELARTVSLGPVTQGLQKEFEQLTRDNKQLREEVEKWRSYYSTNRASAAVQAPAGPVVSPVVQVPAANPAPRPVRALNSSPALGAQTRPASNTTVQTPAHAVQYAQASPNGSSSGRTHTVKSGETPLAIARKYGVALDALLAANPRVEPRRLQVGQTMTIP